VRKPGRGSSAGLGGAGKRPGEFPPFPGPKPSSRKERPSEPPGSPERYPQAHGVQFFQHLPRIRVPGYDSHRLHFRSCLPTFIRSRFAIVFNYLSDPPSLECMLRSKGTRNQFTRRYPWGSVQPTPKEVKGQRRKMGREETVTVDLLHRAVPAKHTDERLRALSGESPIRPESMQKCPEIKFAAALGDVSNAMLGPARSLPASELAGKAYARCEQFRPESPPGKKRWGASGKLDLDFIRMMTSA
jgi:hypothetical protein